MIKWNCFLSELLFHFGLGMQIFPSQNPLHNIGEYKFQDLCRELLEKENNLINSRNYEERGQSQYGADLIADCDDGISTVIGQCKCYKSFGSADFKKASNEFLVYLDSIWNPFNVKKFILLLACKAIKTNQQVAIQEERKRFHEKGIIYEVWDFDRILTKLRPHPQIVQFYFTDAPNFWLEFICKIQSGGANMQPPQTDSGSTLTISFAQAGKIAQIFSEKQTKELNRVKELHLEGKWKEAAEELYLMRNSADEWNLLEAPVQAKILKTIGANKITLEDNLREAKILYEEALRIDPHGDHTIFKATLEYHENGAKEALRKLENPKNIDELNQKIGFYLEMNQTIEALELIENPNPSFEFDIETNRLYALALFSVGRIDEAWVKISQVEEVKPQWEMVQISKAIIGYYSGLAPAAFPLHPLSWAMPVLWQLVKRDSESMTRFRDAEKIFASVLEKGHKKREQRLIYESFRFACLVNDTQRQEEANNYFHKVITDNPSHPFLLTWTQIRGMKFDYENSCQALEEKLKGTVDFYQGVRLEETLVLVDLYLRKNQTGKARQLLQKTRSEFQKVNGDSVYSFWLSRTAVVENKHDEALRIAKKESDRPVGRQIQMMVLRDRYFSQKSNKKVYNQFSRYLEKCWIKHNDQQALVELCYMQAENNHWIFISENYERFIEFAGNADAVRLAAQALFLNKKPTQCLEILETNRIKFLDSILPPDLKKLRIKCYTQLGVYSKAVLEAEELHIKLDSVDSLLTLIEAQLQQGDVNGIVYNAQKILQIPSVEPKYILRVARIAALEDAELAKKLWRRVKDEILEDPILVRDALEIAFSLGLDNESRILRERMRYFANQKNTPFSTFSFKDLWQQMERAKKRNSLIDGMYGKGTLPLHFLAGETNITLATLFYRISQETRKEVDLRRYWKLFTRFGGRSMVDGYFDVKAASKLYIDLTAFLMATELNILGKVEKVFAPIHVPSTLSLALTSERQKLTATHQLAEIIAKQKVIKKHNNELFQLFDASNELNDNDSETYKNEIEKLNAETVSLLIKAKNENAYVVESLPLLDKEGVPIVLDGSLGTNIIDCKQLAENLLHSGKIIQREFDEALNELGEKQKSDLESPKGFTGNTRLYLDDSIVNLLEKAKLLEKVCHNYEVLIERKFIDRIKSEISDYEKDQETKSWLQTAEKRLSEGFSNGKYIGISVEERQSFEESKIQENIDVDVVTELLQLAPQNEAYIWIDDRSVNSHSNSSQIPIITVTDILKTLFLNGELTKEEYFKSLNRLRSGNFRYIPLTTEEILHHLSEAKIISQKVVETEDLSILRRYTAACLLDEHQLQKPPTDKPGPNIFGEIKFVLEMTGVVPEAMVEVWKETEDLNQAEILTDWLFDNLFIGKYGVRRLLPPKANEGDGTYEMGLDFGELLTKALVMHNKVKFDGESKTRRQQYFDWLNRRLIIPRLKSDPNVGKVAARVLENIFNGDINLEFEDERVTKASQLISAELFLDLPKNLINELNVENLNFDWLGISIKRYFTLGKKQFLSTQFWESTERAMNGEIANLATVGSKKKYQIKRVQNEKGFLAIEVSGGGKAKKEIVEHATLGVLFKERTKRIECLRNHRNWFDCDNQTADKEIEEIASLSDPRIRFERINNRIRQSIAVYYKQLETKFEQQLAKVHKLSLNIGDLESFPALGLLNHYRLQSKYKSGIEFSEVIYNSSMNLLAEEGIEETIERLSHLPIKIPESVIVELNKLSIEAKLKLFDDLIISLSSPLCKMQLVDLILRSAKNEEKLLEKAKLLVDEIYDVDRGSEDLKLFFPILRFVNEEFGYLSDTENWSVPVKLTMIWAHAGKLFNLLQPYFENDPGFRKWFWQLHEHSSIIFGGRLDYIHDCLNIRKINEPLFKVHGASALWKENKTTDLKAIGCYEQVKKAISLNEEIAHLELFHASSLNFNSTGSIFGGDRGKILNEFFREEGNNVFFNDAIKKSVEQAIEQLQSDQVEDYSWEILSIMVKNSPIYEDLKPKFINLVENLNFFAIADRDMETAFKALVFIVPQISLLTEKQRIKCEQWLFLLTGKIASEIKIKDKQNITNEMVDYGYKLIEIALTLSFREEDPKASGEKFRDLTLNLINIWNQFGAIIEPAIKVLNRSLPLAQAQYLPEILLNIRASKSPNLIFESALNKK